MTITEIRSTPESLWIDLTRKCQLECIHCYNDSGPTGDHGIMSRDDWIDVLDQAVTTGVHHVQFIGGEPTLHPDALDIAAHALDRGLSVEVYSNLVHITNAWWSFFQRDRASLATSYYSHDPARHDALTKRPSHQHTRRNIIKALKLGIPLRVGIITTDGHDLEATKRELEALGVKRIGVDHVRPFGRGSEGAAPDVSGLCGRCGDGRASIAPDGTVSPCVFSTWMEVGNVRETALKSILSAPTMRDARALIRAEKKDDNPPTPPVPCRPDDDGCRPGIPPSWCGPRR
ncbi:Radical SAM superfamily enzyme, MoaA/NifB/PqqE/SkfB family [Marinactinospora thermotolerans DSM 45154]|uniref:Radical SAM superfamily enzyme, MoaA/NifB/PqqE/SkfB family n=1 Tax=Marinactinospora thermotolerans DSM 45154 TaxID=1122192 RepID=A0A1T4TFL1_9ACTN|nr:radical SAM protein [Marinactinospora thermotolerans]SKA39246.1 Radical SAM superfamily enzyme, MoaA/NifB/PqqE/SkfB family [Marinactinospora thermotolerans DSM 45154]